MDRHVERLDEEPGFTRFNDSCPYLVGGQAAMNRQGQLGVSYRLMDIPGSGRCMPLPVPSPRALRDGTVGDSWEP